MEKLLCLIQIRDTNRYGCLFSDENKNQKFSLKISTHNSIFSEFILQKWKHFERFEGEKNGDLVNKQGKVSQIFT